MTLTEQSNSVEYESYEQDIGVAQASYDGAGEHEERQTSDASHRDRDAHEGARRSEILQQPEQEALDVAPSSS